MAVDTEQGFLGNPKPISVQTDFGLGEQSNLLTKDDTLPSQPYQVTTFQETIAASPAISIGGGYDPYANDLTNIISPFTDPEQIKERREKEKKQRDRVKAYGSADALFQYEPNLNITSPDVPQFAANVPDPTISFSPTPSTELTKKSQTYGLDTELDEDYFSAKYNRRPPRIEGPTRAEVAGNILQEYGMEKVKEAGSELVGDMITDAYKSYFPTRYPSSAFGGGMPASWSGTGYGSATGYGASASSTAAVGGTQITSGAGINQFGQPVYGSTAPAGASMGAKALGYAGAAYGLYNAAEAWGNKDYAGAITSSAWAVASVNPAALPYAVGLEALSMIGRSLGWWGKKPKQGFGGAEILLNKETNQLEFERTYSYNGFDASQAGKHSKQAVQFLNGWSKKFGMKLNYDKAQEAITGAKIRGGNYLRRIDVSPWKDGSGSSSEMIERWIDSGAYEGNPTYYNAELGQRVGFSSQEQYEKEVNQYAKSIFG